ncbi:uncharacterized protein LOC109595358 isoform X2 [Aethina tumida]|nr:uncharacterized protein LOC109595358 isoform X2 [Aethina tumida]
MCAPSPKPIKITNKSPNARCEFNMCDRADKYPTAQIQKSIRQGKALQYKKLAGTVIQPGALPESDKGMLRSLDTSLNNVCRTRKRTFFPQYIKGHNLEKKWIVNVKGFKQGVQYESCASEKPDNVIDIADSETKCVQHYTVVRLLAFNQKNEFEYAEYEVPTTCVCMFERK